MNILDVLRERGFVEAVTHEDELRDYINGNKVTCYIGFDPTASSLHVGSLVCIMALAHMQRMGHRPIALVGGGTGLIGDPSGKTEMRKVITQEEINKNKDGIKKQLSRFIDFSDGKALLLDNGDWLTSLHYIPFLRDIGRHFSVNRMIKAESYKMRLDSDDGLSFIEFNYMLLQAYDFMELSKRYNCMLQMGGSDQWGNIVSGIDLVRRTQQKSAFGITFPLITTSSGIKMGKTHKGAVWLDPEKTTPYEYYQFWVNTDDSDVIRFLSLFTFLPMEEICAVRELEGAELNAAKNILAFEATSIAHGKEEALNAFESTVAMFGATNIADNLIPSSLVPRQITNFYGKEDGLPTSLCPSNLINANEENSVSVADLFVIANLVKSKSEAKRLISQGGGYINGKRISSFDQKISSSDIHEGTILLRAGKKKFHKLLIAY